MAWLDRRTSDGARALGLLLLRAAQTSDRDDLLGLDIRLRSAGFGDSDSDANVCSKIGQALLETLARGDADSIFTAVQAMALLDDGEVAFFANLIAAPLYLERKQFDEAIAAAKSNRSVRLCPTSEYLLLKSVRAKEENGVEVPGGDVSTHDLSDRFCEHPFGTLSTNTLRQGGRTGFFACVCAATLPYPLSYAENDVTIDELWNGEDIQEIRRSILDGDFTYCSRTMCSYIAQGTLPKRNEITDPFLRDVIDNHRTEVDRKPALVTLGHDPSCNLACPSCRCEVIAVKNEEREKLDELSEKLLLPLIADSSVSLTVSSDGDAFASKHYRRLIHSLDAERYTGVKLQLVTNGLLLTPKEWEALGNVQKLVKTVTVSIDGARQETYEDLRRPGKWSVITRNMEFLSQLRREGKIGLGINFVVQKKNFEEMVEFVELGKQWDVHSIVFIRLLSIGSFSAAAFEENDVSDPRHPLHFRLLEILRHPALHEPRVNLMSLAPLQAAADEMTQCSPEIKQGLFRRLKSALGLSASRAA
ncbi:hypothetical protein CU048_00875 [Beijerinckiaceae bacterium]|nr:hypothetical protein CU048_00875 [Beijerinckiaceae bacterium]